MEVNLHGLVYSDTRTKRHSVKMKDNKLKSGKKHNNIT